MIVPEGSAMGALAMMETILPPALTLTKTVRMMTPLLLMTNRPLEDTKDYLTKIFQFEQTIDCVLLQH